MKAIILLAMCAVVILCAAVGAAIDQAGDEQRKNDKL